MVPDVTISLLALLPSTPSGKWLVVGPYIHCPFFLFAFSRSWSCAVCPIFLVLWGKKYLNPSVLIFFPFFLFPQFEVLDMCVREHAMIRDPRHNKKRRWPKKFWELIMSLYIQLRYFNILKYSLSWGCEEFVVKSYSLYAVCGKIITSHLNCSLY